MQPERSILDTLGPAPLGPPPQLCYPACNPPNPEQPAVTLAPRALLERALVDHRPAVRVVAAVAVCLAVALPVGAVLGLAGGLYGAAALIALTIGALMLRDVIFGLVGLIGIICLLPFAALPIDIGFSPTFLDLVLLVTFFVWISRIVTHRQASLVADPPTLPVLVFIALAVASFVLGLGHAPITANVVRHFAEILLSILVFFLVINTVRDRRTLNVLLTALILAGFLSALVGVVLYVLPESLHVRLLSMLRVVRYPSGTDVLRYVEDNPELALRATSTSVDPNVLGGMLIFVTTITAAQAVAPRPVLPRTLLVGILATMVGCMILTYSRGSFAGLAVAIGLMALVRYRKLFWIGLVVLGLLLLLPATQDYVAHFTAGVQGEDLATQMRFGEFRDALDLIGRYPWFGVGFSGTPEIDTYLGVSNVYLLIAEEMGVIGLLAFVAAAGTFFVRLFGALRRCPRGDPLEAPLLGTGFAVVGALAGGMLDHYLFNLDFPHAAALLWLVVGLGTVAIRLSSAPGRDPAPGTPLQP